ncbi:hypothetical protein [Helicobacter sp. 13S00482-2]|nr:hypothetical protein [Helicobacter sp. 13S00482-2]
MKSLIIISALLIALFSGCANVTGNDQAFSIKEQPQHLSGSTIWLPRQ